jgi:YHS domain-containing protein
MKSDPVCGREVYESDAPTAQNNRVTYFFCSKACLGAFEDNPKKWIIEAALAEAA